MAVTKYDLKEFQYDVRRLADKIMRDMKSTTPKVFKKIYGVPRGGIPVAMELSKILGLPYISKLESSYPPNYVLIVDDVVDSGATRERYSRYNFASLHVKSHANCEPDYFIKKTDDWIEYWWEANESPGEDAVTRLIEYIGEDPNREGLQETPKRVIKAYDELFSGYKKDPKKIVKTFDGESYDNIVLLKNIEIYSMCEHHILPFFGKAHIAYIPDGRVIGISKLARLADVFCRRLQIQERIGNQITDFLMKELKPKGAACIIEAAHLCMRMRGVGKQNSIMTTSSLKGLLLEDESAKLELMRLID